MPAIGNLAVNDGQATPVLHTFAPVTTDGAIAKFANRNALIPQGFELMSWEVKTPASKDGAYRLIGTLYDPVEVTVNGVTTIDSYNSMKVEYNFSQRSTAQARLDTLVLGANAQLSATVKSVAQNVEPIY